MQRLATTNPGLLAVPEAARYLGMSDRWMWEQVLEGELPTVRLGRRRLIRPEDLEAFIEERRMVKSA